MQLVSKRNNYIYIGVLIIVIGLIVINMFVAKKQNIKFQEEYITFENSVNYLYDSQIENDIVAVENLKKIHNSKPNSLAVTRHLGIAYSIIGDYKKAKELYQSSLELQPFLSHDSLFLLQFGEVLVNNNDINMSKKVLERATIFKDQLNEEQILKLNELIVSLNSI